MIIIETKETINTNCIKSKKDLKRDKKIKREKRYKELDEPPRRLLIEEIGNSITHGIGALLGVVALVLLLLKSDTGFKVMASIIYGGSLIFMMTMSTLYHAFKQDTKVKKLWRRFDYSGIYFLIGGSFAPLYLVYWGNTLGIVLFSIQWAVLLLVTTLLLIFGPGRLRVLNFIFYFTIGWSALIFIPDFIDNNLNLLYMVLAGGLIYTIGMIPFAMRRVKSAHFIWHFFVLAAVIVHFLGFYLYLY